MKDFFQKYHRLIFYSSWLLLGLIQSSFTQLEDDEAYYWVCSKFLAWGYFDHPPMIALMIKAGYALFHNELGVRLFSLLANTITILILEKILRPKNNWLFYAVILSIGIFQSSGFLAVPDAPLILFTALFFLLYKKFIENPGLARTFLFGIGIALLLYSKYHGVLVITFTLLSNPKLFRGYPLYLSGLIALACYLPHLFWQNQHGWPSVQYHLFERNAPAYKISFTLEYIIGQVLITGPIAGLILVPACVLYPPKDKLEKALRYTLVGIFIFFLLSTFRGRVEANWTAPIIVPLIALGYLYLNDKKSWRSLLYKTLPFTLALVFLTRAAMIYDFLPLKIIKTRYHSWQNWPAMMKEKTHGLPVVFSNSHQRASKYWFYTGQLSYSQQDYKERRSNYNFWPIEDSLLGKPVYFLDIYRLNRFPDSLSTPLGYIGFWYDPDFSSFAKIHLEVFPQSIRIMHGEQIKLEVKASMPVNYFSFIKDHSPSADTTRIGIFNKNGWIKDVYTPLHLSDWTKPKTYSLYFDPHLAPGKYFLRLAINIRKYNGTHNSDKIQLLIE